jgi:hypothetical protein
MATDTVVQHNLITNSNVRHNVEASFDDATKPANSNVVRDNCIHHADDWYDEADGSGIQRPELGFNASSNIIADPQYVNRSAGDFALKPGSPCAGILEGAGVEPLSLQADSPTVDSGDTTTLRGEVPATVTGEVWILKMRKGNWKTFKQAKVSGSSFTAKAKVHKRSRFIARAAGAAESNSVRVTARSSKR